MEKNSESRRSRLFSADSVTVYIPRAAYFRFNYEPKSRINRCLTENPIKHSFQTKPALKHLLSEILTLRSLHMCRAHNRVGGEHSHASHTTVRADPHTAVQDNKLSVSR
jgi:hypothetical protein